LSSLLYKEESYKIIGICFDVYNTMGYGFLENVYQECLEIEFRNLKIPFQSQKELEIYYKDAKLKHIYKADFVCYEKIILEIKAISKLSGEHRGQVLNYLNAAKFQLGLLINFGNHTKLEYERIINQNSIRED